MGYGVEGLAEVKIHCINLTFKDIGTESLSGWLSI